MKSYLECNNCLKENRYTLNKNEKTYCSSCGYFIQDNKPTMIDLHCKYCDFIFANIDQDYFYDYIKVCDNDDCKIKLR